jgi:exonuclease III
MHGFNNGSSMVRDLCLTYDIILLQEIWLLKDNLDKINSLDSNFQSYSLSAMNAKSSSGILVGRPFGGVSILWRKNLSNNIRIIESDESDGNYLSVKLCIDGGDIVITCVYFPCLSSSKEYTVNSSAILSHIENMLTTYPDAKHIRAGDFNFECSNNVGFNMFTDVVKD